MMEFRAASCNGGEGGDKIECMDMHMYNVQSRYHNAHVKERKTINIIIHVDGI